MASNGWHMVDLPLAFVQRWREENPDVEPPRAYRRGELTAFMGREPLGPYDDPDMRWHISLRYGHPGVNGRVPTWEELVFAAHELRPGVPFVVGIPPRSWWMNVHPDVLHLYETRDDALVESWRGQAQAHAPT
jgi:hypothetical protein